MAEEETIEEFEEVKKRRGGGFSKLLQNMSGWQFIGVIILVVIFAYMIEKEASKMQLFIIGFAIVMIILYSKRTSSAKLISEEVAKKIAVENLENKKEEYHISPDTDITPTNFCVLQYKMAEPFKWHVGVKLEDRFGKISYWRVIIHPYEGIIVGVVNEPTGFEGREKDVRDVVVVFPDYMTQE